MATLQLFNTTVNRIDFSLTGLTSEYVNAASFELYYVGYGSSPQKSLQLYADKVKGARGISGFFTGLIPGRRAKVVYRVYDAAGQATAGIDPSTNNREIVVGPIDDFRTNIGAMSISGYDVYDTWGLIPIERPSVVGIPPKTNYVELPGSSESIDFTTALLGRVPYGQRTGSWTFYFDPDWRGADYGALLQRRLKGTLWAYVYGQLMNYVHGRRHSIVLRDDDSQTYYGRLEVGNWGLRDKFSEVTISYNIDPA